MLENEDYNWSGWCGRNKVQNHMLFFNIEEASTYFGYKLLVTFIHLWEHILNILFVSTPLNIHWESWGREREEVGETEKKEEQ